VSPQPEIEAELVLLRPICASDADDYVRWEQDEEIFHLANYGQPFSPRSEEEIRASAVRMVEAAQASEEPDRWGKGAWEIETKQGKHIGHVGHYPINRFAKSTQIAIIIYEHEAWGRGYGTDALSALLGHLFGSKELHRVELRCRADNSRMIRCAEKNGFRPEGTLRESSYCHQRNKYADEVIMAVLDSETVNMGN
jgi:RimJ/RimL family protein N-acetyltransferase